MIVEPLPAWRYHVRQVVAAVLFMALLLAGLHIFGEVLSKAIADHLGYAAFLGTIKGKNQLYKTYQAGKELGEGVAPAVPAAAEREQGSPP